MYNEGMNTLKFSKANAKIKALATVPALQPYLAGKRKVYSFDLLSGHTCPYAKDCHSKAVEVDGKRKVVDGPQTDFRCFSASQEAFYTPLYNLRKFNTMAILPIAAKSVAFAADVILYSIPKNAGIIRIHVGGDFKTRNYFNSWVRVAQERDDVLFYAYTKSLPFWVDSLTDIPDNFVLTASVGGYKDGLISEYGLRHTIVVESVKQAADLKLEIDHDDSHAANPDKRNQNFALLIHGLQPPGSKWGKAVKALNGVGSYKR